jgi:hypothetical protein
MFAEIYAENSPPPWGSRRSAEPCGAAHRNRSGCGAGNRSPATPLRRCRLPSTAKVEGRRDQGVLAAAQPVPARFAPTSAGPWRGLALFRPPGCRQVKSADQPLAPSERGDQTRRPTASPHPAARTHPAACPVRSSIWAMATVGRCGAGQVGVPRATAVIVMVARSAQPCDPRGENRGAARTLDQPGPASPANPASPDPSDPVRQTLPGRP